MKTKKTKKASKKKSAKKVTKKTAPKKGKKAAKKAANRAKKAQAKKIITTTTTVTTTVTTTKANPKETHYLLVLDESSSMSSVRNETRSGLNEQIKTIKNLKKQYPDQDYFVSIVKFATAVTPLIEDVPANKVEEFTESAYSPNGMTALYDAIGTGVNNLKNKIQHKLSSGEASALVVILTDGEENNSREFSSQKIKDLITDLEKTGMWTFTFIGANQDAVLAASTIGINSKNTVSYTSSSKGTSLAFASVNSAMLKRAAYTDNNLYCATTDNFLGEVTRGLSNIGEDAEQLDLSGDISADDIKKAQEAIDNKNNKTTVDSNK